MGQDITDKFEGVQHLSGVKITAGKYAGKDAFYLSHHKDTCHVWIRDSKGIPLNDMKVDVHIDHVSLYSEATR